MNIMLKYVALDIYSRSMLVFINVLPWIQTM